jgi:CubicO group peptidase (beta-lactamase class C family)
MKYSVACIYIILFIECSDRRPKQMDKISVEPPHFITTGASEIGMDTLLLQDLTKNIISQYYPNVHGLLIAKEGWLVYEGYFAGKDQNYGKDIGLIQHTDTTLHDLRSISKSIVSALVGIAIDKGFIDGVDQKISDFFPEMVFEGEKANWTVEHFLTMSTGLQWNEDVPYDNAENDEIRMTYSEDPVAFVLGKDLESSPGSRFNYNGGATQVLAEIVERTSKIPLDEFANDNLFQPLEIHEFEWNKYSVWGPSEKFAAPSGLRLTPRDLMKIGQLYLNNGFWDGKRILNPDWVSGSFDRKVEFPSNVAAGNDGYGYQFWTWKDIMQDKEVEIVAAIGNGGQNIYWDIKNDLIVVTTAGNYNNWEIENDTYSILKNHVYPAIGEVH